MSNNEENFENKGPEIKTFFDKEETSEEAEALGQDVRRTNANIKRKKTVGEEIVDWVKTILIGIIAGVILVVFVVQRDNVSGDSMMPTLYSGDVVFTQKISTYFKHYERGDIVILDGVGMEGYNHSEYLIKRIVGLPGETIKIEDGNVYIKPAGSEDYFILEESYLAEGVKTTMMQSGIDKGYNKITLGEDEYFCLGDNRPVSNDSRNLGPFKEDQIVAIAFIRVYPFDSISTL